MNKKRGISPVIATVMLIGLVIVLGVIVAVWFSTFTQEAIVKFEKNIDLVCQEDVNFDVISGEDGYIEIKNLGTIPIYNFKAIIEGNGYSETKDITEVYPEWDSIYKSTGIEQGSTIALTPTIDMSEITKLTLVPVLLGTSSEGRKTYECAKSTGKNVQL